MPLPWTVIELSRSVESTTSPAGVAPPVNDDCAPTGSTRAKSRKHADTSSVERGRTTPLASPPAKCAASSRNRAISAGSRSISSERGVGGRALARDRTRLLFHCTNLNNATMRVVASYEDDAHQL